MKKATDLRELLRQSAQFVDQTVTVQGWIRNHRKQKNFGFIMFYDGTIAADLQIVYDTETPDFEGIQKITNGSAITVEGVFRTSPGAGQGYELYATAIKVEGTAPEDYPLQPKKHSLEYLRTIGHLRPRARLFQAAFRVRHVAAQAIHTYFRENNFVYVHSPIITANDAEGAGEMFQVTTIPLEKLKGEPDYKRDFFGQKAALTVSGQLEAEIFAMAFKRVYTFGPTFRAENSNTKTHASEFWMIEPEMAFCDLEGLMDMEEDYLKFIVRYVLENAPEELAFLDKFCGGGLIDKLTALVESEVARVDYHDAIDLLINSGVEFENEPTHGGDLAKEHEKYLTDVAFQSPVFVKNWPKEIKAFYMKDNGDGTVAAVDMLVPGAGELTGGSQREDDYNKLKVRMDEVHSTDSLSWYLDLRKYGGCTHAGFGMGFERLLIYLTGIENIRDVLPFPRTPGTCDF